MRVRLGSLTPQGRGDLGGWTHIKNLQFLLIIRQGAAPIGDRALYQVTLVTLCCGSNNYHSLYVKGLTHV